MGTIWKGSPVLLEASNSPRWSFGERITCTRIFRGPWALALSSAPMRGALGTGDMAGMQVSESMVEREKPGQGVLTIKYETHGQPTQGAQLPADEIRCELSQQEVDLRKHSRYEVLTAENFTDLKTLLETDKDSSQYGLAFDRLYEDENSSLAEELLQKLQRGQTHYVVYTATIRVTKHYWTPPGGLSVGGYRESPPSDIISPPAGDYLRAADSLVYNGSTWQLDQQWVGGPDLDSDIYP